MARTHVYLSIPKSSGINSTVSLSCTYTAAIQITEFGRPKGRTLILAVPILENSCPASLSKLGKYSRKSVNIDGRRVSAYIRVVRAENII
jgi:hypothetical protein